ncbi:MAG: hypothetical protein HW421_2994 [Ignavibacteria bacterium]|nr:hypothetical protein [Ignavibacteria bacterium]
MTEKNDKYYLKLVLAGDRNAYGFIVKKYEQAAFNLAYKMLRNRETAEEIVQDGFLSAYRGLITFNYRSSFGTWLYRIIYNLSISYLRKKRIHFESLSNEQNEIDLTYNVAPNDGLLKMESEDRKNFIGLAFGQLESEDRAIMTLFYNEEQSVEKISEIMKISRANVKIKLFRARKKLLIELEKLLHEEARVLL